jgi:hypothetical protein
MSGMVLSGRMARSWGGGQAERRTPGRPVGQPRDALDVGVEPADVAAAALEQALEGRHERRVARLDGEGSVVGMGDPAVVRRVAVPALGLEARVLAPQPLQGGRLAERLGSVVERAGVEGGQLVADRSRGLRPTLRSPASGGRRSSRPRSRTTR